MIDLNNNNKVKKQDAVERLNRSISDLNQLKHNKVLLFKIK